METITYKLQGIYDYLKPRIVQYNVLKRIAIIIKNELQCLKL
jgi:flagellin-specific chaperone FliS